jgi:hypothetical protein
MSGCRKIGGMGEEGRGVGIEREGKRKREREREKKKGSEDEGESKSANLLTPSVLLHDAAFLPRARERCHCHNAVCYRSTFSPLFLFVSVTLLDFFGHRHY